MENMKNDFKKAIVLVGKGPVGKSMLANMFCSDKKAVILSGKNLTSRQLDSKFLYQCCEKDTQLIYVDDLKEEHLECFFGAITFGVTVNKGRGDKLISFVIKPQFIFTVNCNIKHLPSGGSFERRFSVFELKSCNGTQGALTTEKNFNPAKMKNKAVFTKKPKLLFTTNKYL